MSSWSHVCCFDKPPDLKQPWGRMGLSALHSRPQSTTEGSQGRNLTAGLLALTLTKELTSQLKKCGRAVLLKANNGNLTHA